MAAINEENIKRIVVRGTNWVGDAVMTIPALRQLRRQFPNAHITLATRSWTQGLFADADFLDELQVHDGKGLRSAISQIRKWRRENFDLAILLTNSFESALVANFAGIPIRVGYATDKRTPLLSHPIDLPESRSEEHEVFYYLRIVAALEWLVHREQSFLNTEPNCTLEVSETRRAEAAKILGENGVDYNDRERPLIALCPGSINSRAKRWPAERYAALADLFIDEFGAEVLLIGSTGEMEVSREVATKMRNEPVVLTGQTDLAQSVGILSQVDLLVTNDTGPAHIASALGRPTLVIFGPTNPATTRPFSPIGQIIREPPDCAPCMLRDCPIDHRCMTAISPAAVFERAQVLLAAKCHVAATEQKSPLAAAIEKMKFG